jgi:hypothetical protein
MRNLANRKLIYASTLQRRLCPAMTLALENSRSMPKLASRKLNYTDASPWRFRSAKNLVLNKPCLMRKLASQYFSYSKTISIYKLARSGGVVTIRQYATIDSKRGQSNKSRASRWFGRDHISSEWIRQLIYWQNISLIRPSTTSKVEMFTIYSSYSACIHLQIHEINAGGGGRGKEATEICDITAGGGCQGEEPTVSLHHLKVGGEATATFAEKYKEIKGFSAHNLWQKLKAKRSLGKVAGLLLNKLSIAKQWRKVR